MIPIGNYGQDKKVLTPPNIKKRSSKKKKNGRTSIEATGSTRDTLMSDNSSVKNAVVVPSGALLNAKLPMFKTK